MEPNVSVVMPCLNEERYVEKAIESLISDDCIKEFIVIDGGSTDRTLQILTTLEKKHPLIKILHNKRKTAPFALNMGIKTAKGDFIARVDAHCYYPINYLTKLRTSLMSPIHPRIQNVGGTWNTIPANSSVVAKAVAILNSDKLSVGNALYRNGVKEDCFTDTVPFGFFRKELFSELGYFDEELTRNQDDEFNLRIVKNNYLILLKADIIIEYVARRNLSSMGRMFYQYALFKPLGNYKAKSVGTLRQLAPLAFFGSLVALLTMSYFALWPFIVFLILLIMYLVILFGRSILLTKHLVSDKFKMILCLFTGFQIVHLYYAFGYLAGLGKLVRYIIVGSTDKNYSSTR